MKRPYPSTPARRARGFTLAELMIAVAIGLLILAGMTSLFVRNSRAQAEIEKANRQIENGRYGIDVITADLRNAGFYGEFDPTPLDTPAAPPDPCSADLAAIKAALPMHVQGYSNGASLACLADVASGTDVLVVRHTRACVAGDPDCDDVDGPLFQASLCSTELNSSTTPLDAWYKLETDPARLDRTQRDCTTRAVARRFVTHIYYVANNDDTGDGKPTLKRAELRLVGGALQFVRVPLAEGVENLQLEYGIDFSGDGKPDLFTADPSTAVDPATGTACAAPDCAASNWRRVVSVKLNLLARNTEATPGYTDRRTYHLGATTVAARNDGYKRHVFQALVPMPNPIGRRE